MSDFDLKKLDLEHWWKLLAAAGAAIAVASVAVKLVPAFLIGLGLLLFGIGEWRNHPLQTRIEFPWKITSRPWSASMFGILCDVAGLALFGLGVGRLVAS